MTDYLYKFPSESAAQTALADYYDAETGWQTSGEGYALDAVGILTAETGAVDEEGNPMSAPLDGWHLNLRVTDDRPDPAADYSVTPSQQRRVWL
jgi:hypothetical protein